jgi:hypothetical protein
VTGDTSKPRVFVARRIPDEGLRLVLAETDADLWDDELRRRGMSCCVGSRASTDCCRC